jgi:hypothetical protein
MGEEVLAMDADDIPSTLPTTVARPRPLVVTVMAESLNEQGADGRTASAWQWVLAGQGPCPVSGKPWTDGPPGLEEIAAEARHGTNTSPPECGWPPWRYRRDLDPDRQQARRVLRWLTGAADAIPLLDPGRGRHVGARSTSRAPTRRSAGFAAGLCTGWPSMATSPLRCPPGVRNGPGAGPRRG